MMKNMSDSLSYFQLPEDSWICVSHGYGGINGVPVKSLVSLSWIV